MDKILNQRLLREAHKRLFNGEDYQSVQWDFRQRFQFDDDTLEDLTTTPFQGCDCGFCKTAAWEA